jgi:hypothetical protein
MTKPGRVDGGLLSQDRDQDQKCREGGDRCERASLVFLEPSESEKQVSRLTRQRVASAVDERDIARARVEPLSLVG